MVWDPGSLATPVDAWKKTSIFMAALAIDISQGELKQVCAKLIWECDLPPDLALHDTWV